MARTKTTMLRRRSAAWDFGTSATLDRFHSLQRPQPRSRWSKSGAVSAMLDLSIEAAVALEHLQLASAKRLASDALNIAKTGIKDADGLTALPACLIAEVLYEEGRLDQAEVVLRDRLAVVNAEGPIECALRTYRVLSRIAKHRMQYDYAAFLLREAEALGERRGWPRLVAACMAERVSLLLQRGRTTDARVCGELDRPPAQGDARACGQPSAGGLGAGGLSPRRRRRRQRSRRGHRVVLGTWPALGHHGQYDAQPSRRRPRRHRALLQAVHRPYDGLVEGSRATSIHARSAKEAHRRRSCRGRLTLDCRAGSAARRGPAWIA